MENDDCEVRDAAIQAIESWADGAMLELLMGYHYEEEWLEGYRLQVVSDLQG